MPTIAERRANAVLALIDASTAFTQALESVPSYTGQWSDEDYYKDEQAAYDAAVAEYGAAHAPTADEIKAKLVAHLDTDVKVNFEGGQVTVSVGLRWYDDQGSVPMSMRFGHNEDDDRDNQSLRVGECC